MIVNTSSAVGSVAGADGSAGLAVFNPEQEQDVVVEQSNSVTEEVKSSVDTEEAIDEPKSFDEQKFWREIELIAKLGQLKAERDDIELELADAKGDAKSLNDSLSEANELVGDLESDLKDKTNEFMAAAFELCNVARGAVAQLPAKPTGDRKEDSLVGDVENEAAKPDDGWRLHATSDLLSGMKGNKGKRDAVVDLAPTVGHLEDLRAEASKVCVPFNENLPKGCGKGFAQSIEDLLVEFIGKWVAQQSNPEKAKQADELVADVRESAKQNGWQREDCQPKETDSAAMRAGFAAFGECRPYSDVVLDDLHAAKQWMTGWVSGEVLKSLAE
jgi:hypothetical protein